MHNPSHPGELLQTYIGDRTVKEVAEHLGVTRTTLSRVLHGRAGISADMALRIGQLFETDASFWLRLQAQRDLWEASQNPPKVIHFPTAGERKGRPSERRTSRRRA